MKKLVKKTIGEYPIDVVVNATKVFFNEEAIAEVEEGEFDVLMQIPGYEAHGEGQTGQPADGGTPTEDDNEPEEINNEASDEETSEGAGTEPPAEVEEETLEEVSKPAPRVKRPTIKR